MFKINALQLQKHLIESLLIDLYLQNESRRQTLLLRKDNLRCLIKKFLFQEGACYLKVKPL